MSDLERKGNSPPPEPPDSRWRKQLRRLWSEAGRSLIRGASTAVGGMLVTYGAVWLQSRL
ncbi:hypothetical protein GCM10010361_18320 [Streptomyces olivaceiscleroticus]|uniref:Uncharacterized protein n=1 Tax=Streptomyces olivaceiscleroticus TaxID=68245 RepID=A0ABP3JID8_9ACTN